MTDSDNEGSVSPVSSSDSSDSEEQFHPSSADKRRQSSSAQAAPQGGWSDDSDNQSYGLISGETPATPNVNTEDVSHVPCIRPKKVAKFVTKVAKDHLGDGWTVAITVGAMKLLEDTLENFVSGYLEDSVLCTAHGGRKTLQINDLNLSKTIRKQSDFRLKRINPLSTDRSTYSARSGNSSIGVRD